jgi:hypothetical protein
MTMNRGSDSVPAYEACPALPVSSFVLRRLPLRPLHREAQDDDGGDGDDVRSPPSHLPQADLRPPLRPSPAHAARSS